MNPDGYRSIVCPYCGEINEVIVDVTEGQHDYIEDCQVCCRPIIFDVTVDDDVITVFVRSEAD
jgi:transcription elongation factor Elf1